MKNEISERSETGDGRGPVPPSTLLDRTDLILAAIIFAVCGFLFFLTTSFEEASKQMSQNIPPEWFPQLLLLFIMALTLIIPFEHLFMGKKSSWQGTAKSDQTYLHLHGSITMWHHTTDALARNLRYYDCRLCPDATVMGGKTSENPGIVCHCFSWIGGVFIH